MSNTSYFHILNDESNHPTIKSIVTDIVNATYGDGETLVDKVNIEEIYEESGEIYAYQIYTYIKIRNTHRSTIDFFGTIHKPSMSIHQAYYEAFGNALVILDRKRKITLL
jgi:hypothetical protein